MKPICSLTFITKILLTTCFVILGCLVVQFEFNHGPDANLYYASTLNILSGDIAGSIEPVIGPLLSWMMAIPASLEIGLYDSYKISSLFSILLILLAVINICKELELSPAPTAYAAVTSISAVAGAASLMPTSDILCAGFYCLFCMSLLKYWNRSQRKDFILSGIFGTLAYLAKSPELPIILAGLLFLWVYSKAFSKRESKSLVLLGILIVLLCLPWIVLISLKAGSLIFSGQQLLLGNPYSPSVKPIWPWLLGYSFENVSSQHSTHIITTAKSFHAIALFRFELMLVQAARLWSAAGGIFFGNLSLFIIVASGLFGALVSSKKLKNRKIAVPILFLTTAHFGFYFLVWGPHFRYYLSIIPLWIILSARGLNYLCPPANELKDSRIKKITFVLILSALYFASLQSFSNSIWLLKNGPRENMAAAQAIAAAKTLKNGSGSIGGNISPYTGFAAALLKRPYAGSIDVNLELNKDEISQIVCSSGVSQIIWVGETTSVVNAASSLYLAEILKAGEHSVTIYNVLSSKCQSADLH